MCMKNMFSLLFKNQLTHRICRIFVSHFKMENMFKCKAFFFSILILKFDFNSI